MHVMRTRLGQAWGEGRAGAQHAVGLKLRLTGLPGQLTRLRQPVTVSPHLKGECQRLYPCMHSARQSVCLQVPGARLRRWPYGLQRGGGSRTDPLPRQGVLSALHAGLSLCVEAPCTQLLYPSCQCKWP